MQGHQARNPDECQDRSDAGYYPGGKTMVIKLLFADDGLILGASIVGPKGVDKRINVIATAMLARMTVYGLQELEFMPRRSPQLRTLSIWPATRLPTSSTAWQRSEPISIRF